MTSESELVFVGDAGTTEPKGSSDCWGVEIAGFVRPVPWLALDASYSWTDARFDDLPTARTGFPARSST